jgi:hypothetical protein
MIIIIIIITGITNKERPVERRVKPLAVKLGV